MAPEGGPRRRGPFETMRDWNTGLDEKEALHLVAETLK